MLEIRGTTPRSSFTLAFLFSSWNSRMSSSDSLRFTFRHRMSPFTLSFLCQKHEYNFPSPKNGRRKQRQKRRVRELLPQELQSRGFISKPRLLKGLSKGLILKDFFFFFFLLLTLVLDNEDGKRGREDSSGLLLCTSTPSTIYTHGFIYLWYTHIHMISLIVMSQQSFRLAQKGASLHAQVRRLWWFRNI